MIHQTVYLVAVGYRMPTDSSVLQTILIGEKAIKPAYKLEFFVYHVRIDSQKKD
jgi:hypothetical protein